MSSFTVFFYELFVQIKIFYYHCFYITSNGIKSFALCFNPKYVKIDLPDFVLGKHVVPAVDKCKYIGIIAGVANSDCDLKRKMGKYYANVNMLCIQKFGYCSPDVKCCMFKSYCATMYCLFMWIASTVTSMKKFKIA